MNVFFYLYTFYIFYLALALPPIFKATFSGTELFLSDARYIGHPLPRIPINKEIAQIQLLVFSAILYIPTLIIVNFSARALISVVDEFWPVSLQVWRKMQGLLILLISACLAIVSIWLFYALTLKDAMLNFFGVLAIGLLFILSGKR
jgi:hypothetical protein